MAQEKVKDIKLKKGQASTRRNDCETLMSAIQTAAGAPTEAELAIKDGARVFIPQALRQEIRDYLSLQKDEAEVEFTKYADADAIADEIEVDVT